MYCDTHWDDVVGVQEEHPSVEIAVVFGVAIGDATGAGQHFESVEVQAVGRMVRAAIKVVQLTVDEVNTRLWYDNVSTPCVVSNATCTIPGRPVLYVALGYGSQTDELMRQTRNPMQTGHHKGRIGTTNYLQPHGRHLQGCPTLLQSLLLNVSNTCTMAALYG